jgi:hypothetical protein
MEACGDFILPIVKKVWKSDALPGAKAAGKVVQSVLGDDAGVLGAAMLVRELARPAVETDEAEEEPHYPTIRGTRFGQVTIGEKVYESDLCIRADGKIKKRNKAAVKRIYGTSHSIGPDELRKACKGKPDLLVIGTGQEGGAALTREGKGFLKQRGIRFKALRTPAATREYNKAKGRKAALIHVTC